MDNDDKLNIFDGTSWKSKIYEAYLAYDTIDFFLNYAANSGNEILEERIESLESALNLKIK